MLYSLNLCVLVNQCDIEVVFALECERLLGAMLAPSWEDGRIDDPGGNLRLCRIRNLNVVSQKVLNLDFLCSELSTQRGAVESSTEDSCFISVDVECNFTPGRAEVLVSVIQVTC
jgi:hypothetical protein